MADSNANVRSFQAGGVFEIVDGVTTYTMKNLGPGTVKWKDGKRKLVVFTDRGPVQTPLELDDEPGSLELQLRMGSYLAANNSVFPVLRAANTAGNTAKTYTVRLKIPSYRGAAAGEQLEWSNVWLDEAITVEHGSEFDMATIKFGSPAGPTPTAY